MNKEPSEARNAHTLEHAIKEALEHGGHLVPDQGPISVFVHHNTLHAFQHLPFHQAVQAGADTFGAAAYMPEARFRSLFHAGRITAAELNEALDAWIARQEPATQPLPNTPLRDLWWAWLAAPVEADTPGGLAWRLAEEGLASSLPQDLPAPAREALLRGGQALLAPLLEKGDLDGVLRALTGAAGRPGEEAFWTRFGVVASLDAARSLLSRRPDAVAAATLWEVVRRRTPRDEPAAVRSDATRARMARLVGEDAWRRAGQLLAQLSGVYLDEGLAYWPLQGREKGFVASGLGLLLDGAAPEPWMGALHASPALAAIQSGDADATLRLLLQEWGVRLNEVEPLILELLHLLPGWAGMFSRLERHADERAHLPGPVRLADYAAVALALIDTSLRWSLARAEIPELKRPRDVVAAARQRGGAPRRQGDHGRPLRLFLTALYVGLGADTLDAFDDATWSAWSDALDRFDAPARQSIWQEAYELRYEGQILSAIDANRRLNDLASPRQRPRLQAAFCIDDREESLRRALEELDPAMETFGIAGFFGLAIAYKGLDQAQAVTLCPVGVDPPHEIHEVPVEGHEHLHGARASRRRLWARLSGALAAASRSAILGGPLAVGLGPATAGPFTARVVAPGATDRIGRWLQSRFLPAPQTRLTVDREARTPQRADRVVGYTFQEQVDRAAIFFENIGARSGHARLFLIVGHGSTTQNNPHRSAYDCGACSGKHGDANARLMALIANKPEIRAALRERGVDIADDTWFIGCIHDTTSDDVRWFDLDRVPDTHREDLQAAQRLVERARALDALERCRRFVSAQGIRTPERALRHAEDRAQHVAEPRPECGHATNALCIVGRRALTRGLYLDRRAFLVSYDPLNDPDERILERLLAAVGPVGAGINLEYYFSYIDNERYGCGTKLPHNVMGMIGVVNGAEGDLRTGLPWQMVEIHEPVRLLVIVEGTPERLLSIAGRQPVVRELVVNGWIRLAVIDPESGAWHVFRDGAFHPSTPEEVQLPVAATSPAWFLGHLEHLPPARITAGLELTQEAAHGVAAA